MKIKTTIMAVLIATALSTFATQQASELIIINGQERDLLSEPLYPYLEGLKKQPKVLSSWESTNLYRGYVGTWIIKENHLWLVEYRTADDNGFTMKKRPLRKLNKWWWRGPVRAEWFTGELYVINGKVQTEFDDGMEPLEPVYESYLAIAVDKGAIERVRKIDHKTMWAEMTAAWDRPPLAVIGPDVKLKTIEYQLGWYAGTDDVAYMHGITVEAFRKLNGLGPDEELKPGAKVKVPCSYQ